MDWYYPNYTNDMWRIFGLHFFGDKMHFVDEARHTFRLTELQTFLSSLGVAIYDTAVRVRRTKGTASDKDLDIVEPADLDALLDALPQCRAVLTAGQLAAMGQSVPFSYAGRELMLYRQPSSSRAYPMKVELKTEYYSRMFDELFGDDVAAARADTE